MAEINELLSPKAEKQQKEYKAFLKATYDDLKKLDAMYASLATSINEVDKKTKKVTKDQKSFDAVTIETNKLLKQKEILTAKQDKSLTALTKETIKQKEAIKEQNRQLREQAKADLGIKKRSGLFREVTKSIVASLTVMGLATGALKLIWAEISRTQGFQDKWTQGMNASRAAMDTLTGSIKEAVKGNGGFQDFNKRLDESIAKSIELTKRTQELTKAQIAQLSNLNGLLRAEELYRAISDDATLSFQKREAANEKAFAISVKRLDQELEFAGQQLDNDAALLQNKLDNNQVLTNDELTKNQQLKAAYDNARVARRKADFDYSKFKRELELDDFEQQLDFIFDVGDKRKTANEKLIADESLTAAQRIAILNDTNRILNESFDDQINLFESENKLQIDRNKLLTLNNKESFEYARGLGLSERATNRLLEVIRERIAATSDMDEAQKSLNKSILKGREDELSLINNLVDNEKQLAESTLTISKEITEGRKVQYDKDLQYAKDTAQAKIDLNKQVLDSSVSATQEVGNILFDLGQSQLDRQLETIGTEYNARILAAEGNTEVQERLAGQLADKQNEIKRQQAKSERNQALFNIALNTFQGISAAVAASPLTFGLPFSAFVGLIGAAQAAAVASQPLPEFFMGTSDTPYAYTAGERGEELKINQDGSVELTPNKKTTYIGKEHQHAQIIPNKQTQEILANKASGESNRELLKEMRLTRKAIERSRTDIHLSRSVPKLDIKHFNRQHKRN